MIALPLRRWRWRAFGVYLVLFAAVLGWCFSLEPSNDRDWVAENARLAYATIDGDIVTVHNIRNFAYRSETDFTPAYYDKRFDLSQLEGVDLVAVYWMGPAIAHIFLSFAFAGGDHLAMSIETRKEKGEGYSTVKGFFRQYELYYVVADERDVIGLRTNYRHDPPEQVYVLPAAGSQGGARRRVPRLHGSDQRAEGAARVLQLADHQLHHQDLDALAGQPGASAVQLEDPGQRLRAGVPVRAGAPRHDGMPFAELQRRAHGQCARAGRRARRRTSRAASG